MRKMYVVEFGSWSQKYAFEHLKDASDFFNVLCRAQKCDTTYDDGEYAYPVEASTPCLKYLTYESTKRVKEVTDGNN